MIKTEYLSPASSNEQLTSSMPYGEQGTSNIYQLLQQVKDFSDEGFDQQRAHTLTQQLTEHRLCQPLFEIFSTIKSRKGPLIDKPEEPRENSELLRLDNMLMAENVMGPEKDENTSESITDQSEYKDKLKCIRKDFDGKMDNHQYKSGEITNSVVQLLKDQSRVRPIMSEDINKMISVLQKKFYNVEMQIKQSTCEEIMSWKARFLDARRKRRNFPKQATDILQRYFDEHLSNPYPSEADKEELARRCNIKVNQVSNWFGNKRIRYKKQNIKRQEIARSYGTGNQEHYHPYAAPQTFPTYNMLPGNEFQNFGMYSSGFDLMNGYTQPMMAEYNNVLMPPPSLPRTFIKNEGFPIDQKNFK